MEEQISASQVPQQSQGISPEQLESMKAYAREQAIKMSFQQQPVFPQVPQPPVANLPYQPRPTLEPKGPETLPSGYIYMPETVEPQVVYVRRNMTVAEILVMTILSCVIVGGIQGAWSFTSKYLPQIEIRVK
jgi:hypothetical protein